MARYDDIEELWSAILSEDATELHAAWQTLDAEERREVLEHLEEMADPEEGYAEVQQASARFALKTLAASSN